VTLALRLLDKPQDIPDDVRDILSMMGETWTSKSRFINELLDVSRITHGKLELAPRPVSCIRHFRGGAGLASDFEAKRQTLRSSKRPSFPLDGDPGRLEQVFLDLLKNARSSRQKKRIVFTENQPASSRGC